ncbi:MAG: MinD/ParA family protein [Pseudomonadales bacterium]|nr:MinD/ParA family protein [Pseudomonadales bacterium]
MADSKPIRVIAVTGGKGGVGKTNISVNLGAALANRGNRVVLLDGDMGLANIDVVLGLTPAKNISDVLSGEATLKDVMVEGPSGMKVIPAASGVQDMVNLSPAHHSGIIHAFSELSDQLDVLIIDTAAGISSDVVNFVKASQEVLVVVCDEPASITDAYGLIKMLSTKHGVDHFRVLANMVRSDQEGMSLFSKLQKVTSRFLDINIQYAGCIPHDENLRKAIKRQRAVYQAYPKSNASIAFDKLANQVGSWPLPTKSKGYMEFFAEQLVMSQTSVNF